MATATLTIPESIKEELKKFSWINWSEVAREEYVKKEIFERFIKTGTLSENDQEFCDSIDWYPVDELPLREEYVKKLKRISKGPHIPMTLDKLDKLMGLK